MPIRPCGNIGLRVKGTRGTRQSMPRKIIDMPKGMHFKWRTLDWTPGSLLLSCPWLTCLMSHSKESFLSGHEPTSCGMYAKPAIPEPPVESTHLPWFWNLLSRPNLYILKNEQFFFPTKRASDVPLLCVRCYGPASFSSRECERGWDKQNREEPGTFGFLPQPLPWAPGQWG